MSGGSYDYLFAQPLDRIGDRRGDIERMRDRLAQLTHTLEGPAANAAAIAHGRCVVLLWHLDRAAKMAGTLTYVWRAVEWLDSSDHGVDSVARVLVEWEETGRGAGD